MKVTKKNLLASFPTLDAKSALTIVRLVNETLDPESLEPGRRRVQECYNRPDTVNLILTCINSILNGYGVEGVEWRTGAMYSREFISYVNFGDTYSTTILFNPDSGKIEIGDWGSVYETSPAFSENAAQNC